jgi:hypothetical protein
VEEIDPTGKKFDKGARAVLVVRLMSLVSG